MLMSNVLKQLISSYIYSIYDAKSNQFLLLVNIKDSYNIENTHAAKQFGSLSPVLDAKERRNKIDSERYARKTNEEKQEKLKMRRQAYQ
mgnify:CR=1 FL=1